jgi:dolichol-phosphate mannosyltransferase
MKPRVALIIPCYRASEQVGLVVNEALAIATTLNKLCELEVIVVNDACPELSWHNVPTSAHVQVIHHPSNGGVGAATLTGFQTAVEQGYSVIVKLDADGQHPPSYLLDLVPYLLVQPSTDLLLVKGSRYRWPSRQGTIPWARQLGSVLLEPMARAALGCRNLTDICNGFLGLNALSCRYLLATNLGPPLQRRYLFESSVLVRSCWLGLDVREFAMLPRYGPSWNSSMDSGAMVLPLLRFWSGAAWARLQRCYLESLNLGSALLLVSSMSVSLAGYLWLTRVGPEIAVQTQVSAGTSSAFTTASATALLSLLLFFLYDYRSGSDVKTLRFAALLDDLERSC